MANYRLRTQLGYGKYKNWKVHEIIQTLQGRLYLKWLHNSSKNVKLTQEVIEEMDLMDGVVIKRY